MGRSADAEPKADADPWYTGGYAGHYGVRPYYGGYHLGYAGYGGYGHYLGKRSADAEPKADADPWYNLGYGYGRGSMGAMLAIILDITDMGLDIWDKSSRCHT